VELTFFLHFLVHRFQLSDIDSQLLIIIKEIILNAMSLFIVLTTDICTQLFVRFEVMCNSTTKVISVSKLKYSYPPLAGNILFHNILNQLCLLYSASFEFLCFCYICLSVVYWYCHSLTPWLCGSVRALASLFVDFHSVWTAFCCHLITITVTSSQTIVPYTHTHHWFKITPPNTDQAHDKHQ
jgi:hypothetical protein